MVSRRTFAPLLLAAAVSSTASAQVPPATTQGPTEPASRIIDPYLPMYSPSRYQYHSRTAPPPPHDPEADYGFRNPGGVGRVGEFYPPGNTFERGTDPVRVAQFGGGPSATSRQSQMEAQQLGIQRNQTLNQHIDAYARPFGYGYGFGFGYGFGARFPY